MQEKDKAAWKLGPWHIGMLSGAIAGALAWGVAYPLLLLMTKVLSLDNGLDLGIEGLIIGGVGGVLVGSFAGLLLAALGRWMPASGPWKGLVIGMIVMLIFEGALEGFQVPVGLENQRALAIGVIIVPYVVYGLILGAVAARLDR